MKFNLKKMVALLLAAILMLSLSGLGEDAIVIEDGAAVEGDLAAKLDDLNVLLAETDLETPQTDETIDNTKAVSNALVKKVTIGVNEKYTIDTSSLSGKLTYKSSKPEIANVSKKGVIKGKKVGTAKITVTTAAGKKYKVTVTVANAPSTVTLNKTSATLEIGDTLQLKAKLPSKTTSNKITWTSSNKSVATVSDNGKVTARAAGTTTITVKTFNGKKATCKVTVKTDEPEPTPTPTPTLAPTPTPKPTPKILTLSDDMPIKLSMGLFPTEQEYMIDSFKCEVVELSDYNYKYKFSFGGVKTKDINGDSHFTQYPINWELYGYVGDVYTLMDRGQIRTPLVRVGDRWSMDSCCGMTNIPLNYDFKNVRLSDHLFIHTILS